uniref:Uncharacterized protein n=1 Tax=Arundo donax TaxID=35708 RepID=A0A0A9BQA9_ARUDO
MPHLFPSAIYSWSSGFQTPSSAAPQTKHYKLKEELSSFLSRRK